MVETCRDSARLLTEIGDAGSTWRTSGLSTPRARRSDWRRSASSPRPSSTWLDECRHAGGRSRERSRDAPDLVVVAIDGPAGSRQVEREPGIRSRSRLRLPGHRGRVPCAGLVCLAHGVDTRCRTVIGRVGGIRVRASASTPTTTSCGVDGQRRDRDDPRAGGDRRGECRRPDPGGAREPGRAVPADHRGQRQAGHLVEGRDITTVVAPDAQVRILLTASEQVRIGRRSAELTGESAEKTAQQLASRDAQDSRVVDFMNAADG